MSHSDVHSISRNLITQLMQMPQADWCFLLQKLDMNAGMIGTDFTYEMQQSSNYCCYYYFIKTTWINIVFYSTGRLVPSSYLKASLKASGVAFLGT